MRSDWDVCEVLFFVCLYRSRPVFVVLRFTAHSLAWEAYVKLSSAIEEGAPFKLSWTRTSWYYNVKAKAKEMQTINQILLEDIEHSEGRLDGSSAADYLSTLEDEDEEEYDDLDPIVRSQKHIKPIQAITESSVLVPVEVIIAAAAAPVEATPTPTPTVAASNVNEVVVKKKRRSAQEVLHAKEQKIAEKALKKSLKASPTPKASKTKAITPPAPKASKTKTFTFPVLHEPVRLRGHFYDSDGEIVTVKADKLRGGY